MLYLENSYSVNMKNRKEEQRRQVENKLYFFSLVLTLPHLFFVVLYSALELSSIVK